MNSILPVILLVGCVLDGVGFSIRVEAGRHRGRNRACSVAAPDDAGKTESNKRKLRCPEIGTDEKHQQPDDFSSQLTKDQWHERQRRKQTRLFGIQQEILERLGLRRRPNVTSTNLTREELERYEELLRHTDSHDRTIYHRHLYAKRYQILPSTCSPPRNSDSSWNEVPSNEMRLHFSIEPNDAANRLRDTRISVANLRLKKKPNPDERKAICRGDTNDDSIIRITVYAYTKPVKRGMKEQKSVVSSLLINRSSGLAWIRIDIRGAVEDWMRRRHRNDGLQVTVEARNRTINPLEVFETLNCTSPGNVSTHLLNFTISEIYGQYSSTHGAADHLEFENNSNLPPTFLDLVTVDVPRRRSSRGYRDLQTYNQRSLCRIEKMFISFAELGWGDWIVQPKGFETGFCRGSCSKRTNTRITSRKFSTELLSLRANDCCGPVRAKALSVLHYNDMAKLSISLFDDFIVTECGCRR